MLNKINKILILLILLFIFLFLTARFLRQPTEIFEDEDTTLLLEDRKAFSKFELSPPEFEAMFGFNQPSLPIQTPNLSLKLNYWGTNIRPDIKEGDKAGAFSWKEGGEAFLLFENKKNYLIPTRQEKTPYEISVQSTKTPLFLEVSLSEKEAIITVGMTEDEGAKLTDTTFRIAKNEGMRAIGQQGMLGDLKVDGSLLIRQKARWFGKDLFLENHGGDEYAAYAGKERIVFHKEDQQYPFYLKEKEFLYWFEDFWVAEEQLPPEINPLSLPLLELNKQEERILRFFLWGPEGKYSFPMTLVKMPAPWIPLNYINQFKFLGIRSKQAWNFEIGGERKTLRPSEWLLKQEDKWIILETETQIDDYVDGRLLGELVVLSRLGRKEGKQVIFGHIFNAQRSEKVDFELPYDSKEGIIPLSPDEEEKQDKKEPEPPKHILKDKEPVEKEAPPSPRRVRRARPESE